MHTTLIEPTELATRLADPSWAILDCRFELAQPQWGASAYAAGHIPHALYAHLDEDLSGPVAASTGRHPLPEINALAETFGRWGIDAQVQVVAYDQGNGAYAARLWWLLRWMGHSRVAVLNGGFAAWQRAGLPVDAKPATRQPRRFVALPTANQVVTTAELERALARGELATGEAMLLVDARAADRFAGENETIDPVAGHVPGAHNHPFARNLEASGEFLPAPELRRRWQATLRKVPAERAISMCGSGVTACHNLLALEIAGLSGARLYAGSWSEWIRDPARPVARSATPAR
ncbi:MAG: sulfurtransferase [Gammaproteobacteria bacterium]|nr:MAG: sulfurtransferase [Gammaproteobacteria bacterium]